MSEGNQMRFRVGGMDCASCAGKIETAVRRMPGVEDVSVSVTAGTLLVSHDGSGDATAIAGKVEGLGYAVAPAGEAARTAPKTSCCAHDHDHKHDHGAHDQHDAHAHGHGHGKSEADLGLHGHDHGPMDGPWWKSKKGRLTIASGVALALAYGLGHLVPAIAPYAFLLAMAVGLVPIARRAVMAALAGTPFSIEMLMTIAAIGAV